jgi:hypothetical protein
MEGWHQCNPLHSEVWDSQVVRIAIIEFENLRILEIENPSPIDLA